MNSSFGPQVGRMKRKTIMGRVYLSWTFCDSPSKYASLIGQSDMSTNSYQGLQVSFPIKLRSACDVFHETRHVHASILESYEAYDIRKSLLHLHPHLGTETACWSIMLSNRKLWIR